MMDAIGIDNANEIGSTVLFDMTDNFILCEMMIPEIRWEFNFRVQIHMT